MPVIISPNIKRVSERIDTSGNIINARTKEIIKPNTIETVSPEDMKPKVSQETIDTSGTDSIPPFIKKSTSKIDEMINNLVAKKVEEMVAQKVEEALKNL